MPSCRRWASSTITSTIFPSGSVQAGLSWLTILRKRENFRRAFSGFHIETVARYTSRNITRLLGDAGIVRHRGKIEATIHNAQRACEMAASEGSLAAYFWSWEPLPSSRPKSISRGAIVSTTPESIALSKDLKKRGWSFVGPTTCYAFMQAMGLVNDHTDECFARGEIERFRKKFTRPSARS